MEHLGILNKNMRDSRYAVILAGGSGIRLWPLSREALPKQLIPVIGGKSLLEVAFDRLDGVIPAERRWVCGGQRFEFDIKAKIPTLGRYLGEPVGRDTLAAIGYSCAMAMAVDRDATVAFLTSDHVIRPVERFTKSLALAFETVEANPDALLTFGIKPTYPATAYGYLELGDTIDHGTVQRVLRFKEKPNLAVAEDYLTAGSEHYLWNSGMFIWKAERFLALLSHYEPDVAQAVQRIAAEKDHETHDAILAEIYPSIRKKSVDYGIMERASLDPEVRVICLPLDLEWKDIGSWTAYGSLAPSDSAGNTAIQALSQGDGVEIEGTSLIFESTDTLVVSTDPGHLITCFGCEGLAVIHTKDVTFIAPKERVEEMKKLHTEIKSRFEGEYI
jgi:mannose-1-phosphate guanylyltransferase